jgi:integrase
MDTRGITKHRKTWKVDTRVSGHRVVETGFKTRAEAQSFLFRLRADPDALKAYLTEKLLKKPHGVTVEVVLATYWEEHAQHLSSASKCKTMESHLVRHLGKEVAQALRGRHVDRYQRERLKESACNSPKTAFNEAAYLRGALTWAWREDILPAPPKIKLSRPKSRRTRVAKGGELKRLWLAADLPMQRVLLAGLTTGMRRGEIIGARWDWVSEDDGTHVLSIPAEVTKTNEAKEVVLPPELVELLQCEPRHPVFLFARWHGGPNGKSTSSEPARWHATNLQRERTKLLARAGVTDLWLHDLRRTMASDGLQQGHALQVVQAQGGWADHQALLSHYAHSSRSAQAALATGMVNQLKQAVGGCLLAGSEAE